LEPSRPLDGSFSLCHATPWRKPGLRARGPFLEVEADKVLRRITSC
jgi:hypothetical protein